MNRKNEQQNKNYTYYCLFIAMHSEESSFIGSRMPDYTFINFCNATQCNAMSCHLAKVDFLAYKVLLLVLFKKPSWDCYLHHL